MNHYKLKGLNKPRKAAGFNSIYATVDTGTEDWFHAAFDSSLFSDDKLNELFGMFKNNDDNLWSGKNHQVRIEYNDQQKPIIKELILDNL